MRVQRMTLTQKRKIFQWVKTLSLEHFWELMDYIASQGYNTGKKHFTEAAESTLPPRYQKVLLEQADKIRTVWDGLDEVTSTELLRMELEKQLQSKGKT